MASPIDQTATSTRRMERAAVIVFALIVTLHCVAVLGFVVRHGRLSVVPLYDDVSYLADGYRRLGVLDASGLPGLTASLFRDPPHAPFSTVLATLGFALTPGSGLGSYVLNVLWIGVFVALGWRVLAGTAPTARLGLIAAALSVPMLATALGSFRPDVPWGLMTGAVAIVLVSEGIARGRRIDAFLTGLLVGATLLCKPTGLPSSAAVLAVGFIGGVGVDMAARRMRPGEAAWRTLSLCAGAALVVAPYLAVAWSDLYVYIQNVMVRDVDMLRTPGGLATYLAFYLRPVLALEWLGWLLYAAPALFVGAVAALARTPGREAAARVVGVALVVAAAYAITTISPVKTGFIGSLLYGAIVMAALWSAGRIALAFQVPAVAVFVAGLAVFATAWRPGDEFMRLTAPNYIATDRATRAVTPAIMAALAADQDGTPPIVYTSSPGPIYDGTLQYEALLRGLKGVFVGAYTDADWQHVQSDVARSSIVIATEDGASGQDHGFPFPMLPHQADIIAMLSADPAWHAIATYVDDAGFRTVAFSQISQPAAIKLSFGVGFRGEEGPAFGLPRFRWMTAPTATLRLRAVSDEAHTVATLMCEAPAPVAVSVARPSGAVIAERSLPAAAIGAAGLEPIEVPLDGPAADVTITAAGGTAPGWPGPMLCAVAPSNTLAHSTR